ncbi:CKLF-like MARVEL transmembrane domain containing 8, isoform CRA_b [Mus musculus]|nr:CKLF-like MARVEL transmembrane domain containing 8, isoform CRA_b [Mus musculus]
MEEQQRARSHTVTTTTSSFAENFSTTSSSFAYDREFLRTPPGLLIVAEIVLGLLVWTLIAGTEYFRVPAFGWVMFVAVFYWVLTVFFLIVYITLTYTRIPQVPWTTVVRTPRGGTCPGCEVGQQVSQGRHLPGAVRWDSRCLFLWIWGHLCSRGAGQCWRSQQQ